MRELQSTTSAAAAATAATNDTNIIGKQSKQATFEPNASGKVLITRSIRR
jgi:hypothetical protein